MTRWVRTLILVNAVVYFLTSASPDVAYELAFIPALALRRPWTIVTYMFVHAGFGHVFFNMLGLFFFGSRVESRLGDRWFLNLYFFSGFTGALLSLMLSPGAAIVGASAAVFGVSLAYARYWPNDVFLIWGIVPMTARMMVIFNTVLAIWGGQGFGMPGVAHFAHLGGYLGGWLYLVLLERMSPAARFRAKATVHQRGGGITDIQRWMALKPDGLHAVNREELQRLQQQISEGQAGRLTPDEKAFLNRLAEAAPPAS